MTSRLTSSKLLLIADSRPGAPAALAVPIRRYRIARLRVERNSMASAAAGSVRKAA